MSGSTNTVELSVPYPDSVDGTQKCIFDHDVTEISKDYGYYGGYDGLPIFNPINTKTTVVPNVGSGGELGEALELLKKLKEDYPAIEREIENPDDAPLDGGTF